LEPCAMARDKMLKAAIIAWLCSAARTNPALLGVLAV